VRVGLAAQQLQPVHQPPAPVQLAAQAQPVAALEALEALAVAVDAAPRSRRNSCRRS
jgi:hypothetical protein